MERKAKRANWILGTRANFRKRFFSVYTRKLAKFHYLSLVKTYQFWLFIKINLSNLEFFPVDELANKMCQRLKISSQAFAAVCCRAVIAANAMGPVFVAGCSSKFVKNTPLRVVLTTLLSVIGNVMKHFLECLVYYIKCWFLFLSDQSWKHVQLRLRRGQKWGEIKRALQRGGKGEQKRKTFASRTWG